MVELVFFGMMEHAIGRGFGRWFLGAAIEAAWAYHPERVIVQTCTLDHPSALALYQKMGFVANRPVAGKKVVPLGERERRTSCSDPDRRMARRWCRPAGRFPAQEEQTRGERIRRRVPRVPPPSRSPAPSATAALVTRPLCRLRPFLRWTSSISAFIAAIGQLQAEMQRGVVEGCSRRDGHRTRHVGDAIMHDAVDLVGRLGMGGGVAGLETAALVDGDVDEHGTGLHARQHLAADKLRGGGARDQHRARRSCRRQKKHSSSMASDGGIAGVDAAIEDVVELRAGAGWSGR